MSTQTAGGSSQKSDTEPVVPEQLAKVVAGQEITGREELSALDFLLGPTVALQYDLIVRYETPLGIKPLTVRFQQLDPAKFEEHDAANRKGDGPFAKLDVPAFNAGICADAILSISDESRTVGIRTDEFRGGMPGGAALALLTRFKFQGGLLDGMVEEIKRVSGYSPDRVGTAQRVVVEAGKDS